MRRESILLLILVAGIAVICGCTMPITTPSAPAQPAAPAAPAVAPAAAPAVSGETAEVSIIASAFDPAILNIRTGTTVIWTNDDRINHRVEHLPELPSDRLLFRSVTNACINRQTRRRDLLSLDAEDADGRRRGDGVSAPATPEPGDVAIGEELRDAVEAGLKELPALQRAAVELKAMDYSLSEIGAILDVSVSNAGVLIHRGRKDLARRLGRFLNETERTEP